MTTTQILQDQQVQQIMKRLAFQVYEQHSEIRELIVASINGKGTEIADRLCKQLAVISNLKVVQASIQINKDHPEHSEIQIEPASLKVKGKYVVVVDDVLNSGRTLIHAINPFIRGGCTRLQTLVLVDRNHRSFPVSADYIGLQLATTRQEHVDVKLERKKISVYLK